MQATRQSPFVGALLLACIVAVILTQPMKVQGTGECKATYHRLVNVTFDDDDIAPFVHVSSPDDCCNACVSHANCTVWTFVPGEKANSNGCHLKHTMDKPRVMAHALSSRTVPVPPGGVPVPTPRQLEFMEMELVQFMHFGIPTFWDPPKEFLYTDNPTYHDCHTTNIDHSNQTEGYYPCLNPRVFSPTNLSADDWMSASKAMGMKEICITAHHEGGFALWPSKYSNYSVAASAWRNGTGDVLREFVDAAHRWGINICYYLNVQSDGYMTYVAKVTPEEFIERQVGMIEEVLDSYGPVSRFWFDGTSTTPKGTDLNLLWSRVYNTIRSKSPCTIISPYRGDVCSSIHTLYTNQGPPAFSNDTSGCQPAIEGGRYFHPTEMHGITIQEGPDGNSDEPPTYWFWHPWACAKNISGCPWVGHANASRVFDSYLVTVGHGAVLNMNIPPERTGRMNVSVAQVMHDVGKAINDTFNNHVAAVHNISADCGVGVAVLEVGEATANTAAAAAAHGVDFDYIVTMEDLTHGQRIANYSIEYQRKGSDVWHMLVPPVGSGGGADAGVGDTAVDDRGVGDRPDGHDPRDQYVGHKRIDVPAVNATEVADIARVRFNCISAFADPVYIRQLSLHKKSVPWE